MTVKYLTCNVVIAYYATSKVCVIATDSNLFFYFRTCTDVSKV